MSEYTNDIHPTKGRPDSGAAVNGLLGAVSDRLKGST